VQATQLLKREAGEPADFHRYASATAVGGALSCEDCCVMLSGDLHREFAIPYTRQTLDALGGGWVHFCGDGRRLLDDYLAIPSLHGIFFGQLHLNGPMHETALKLISHGKALNYIPGGGYTPSARPGFAPARAKAESWPDFFRRVLEPFDRKKGIYLTAFAFTDDAKTGESLLRLWHEAQDARFG
jgi:hypothetical protein